MRAGNDDSTTASEKNVNRTRDVVGRGANTTVEVGGIAASKYTTGTLVLGYPKLGTPKQITRRCSTRNISTTTHPNGARKPHYAS